MDRPIISIITPVYNLENYIERCVESDINQTFTAWEYILVDDGSTDNSVIILKEYIKKYLQIAVYHSVFGGVSAARNMGIDKAKGKYICFIDGDDFIVPNMLESMVEQFREGVDLVQCSYDVLYDNGNCHIAPNLRQGWF